MILSFSGGGRCSKNEGSTLISMAPCRTPLAADPLSWVLLLCAAVAAGSGGSGRRIPRFSIPNHYPVVSPPHPSTVQY